MSEVWGRYRKAGGMPALLPAACCRGCLHLLPRTHVFVHCCFLQVSEQTDSLRVLGSDPVDYLITPRVLACMIALPILNLLCFCMGGCWAAAASGCWAGVMHGSAACWSAGLSDAMQPVVQAATRRGRFDLWMLSAPWVRLAQGMVEHVV